ncbi:MAG: hypothetical protein JO077_05260 [Verrucomicrobia bacterium]|nr:hypothetical protein [Verrucomicrobiota bacterium]
MATSSNPAGNHSSAEQKGPAQEHRLLGVIGILVVGLATALALALLGLITHP